MMKKHFAVLLILLLLIQTIPVQAETSDELDLSAESAVLIDAVSGQVLYNKDMNKREYPASITKIMTAYLAAKEGQLKDDITVTKSAIEVVPKDTSNIALVEGEQITCEDALYATILTSANDAANVLAEYISGTIDSFASKMTETALEMGAVNTNFTNANGLHDDNHYTTAYDMAKITLEALKDPTFEEIFTTKDYTMNATNMQDEQRNFSNQHRMMQLSTYQDLGVIGGKAGTTTEAQNTLVTVAEKDGMRLIAVMMKCSDFNQMYRDTRELLEYGYNNFTRATLSKDEIAKKTISVMRNKDIIAYTEVGPESDFSFILPKSLTTKDVQIKYTLNDTIQEGDEIEGEIEFYLPSVSEKLGTVNLIELSTTANWSASRIVKLIFKIILYIILILIGLFLLLLIAGRTYRTIKRSRRKRRRTRR